MTVMRTHKQEVQDKFSEWLRITHPRLFEAANRRVDKMVNKGNSPPFVPSSYDPSKFGYNPNRKFPDIKYPFVTPRLVAVRSPKRRYTTQPFISKSQLNGMGEGWGDFFTELTSSVVALAPQYLQFQNQRDMLKVQVKRAREGLPPVDTASYGPQGPVRQTTIPPQPQSPASPPIILKGDPMLNMKTLTPVLIGAGVLAVVFLLKKKRR